jgi:hypothetical protein
MKHNPQKARKNFSRNVYEFFTVFFVILDLTEGSKFLGIAVYYS